MSAEAERIGCIALKLPKSTVTAGRILQHAVNVIEGLFSKYDPMIFKIGFTHNPAWRWENKVYGYMHSQDKWSNMTVLYGSMEPYGPAMLEAALIEKYEGPWKKSQVVQCFEGICKDT